VIRLAKTLLLALAAFAAPAAAQDGGPVLPTNFPDPFVLPVGSRYYAYATNANGSNVPMAFSSDLRTWNLLAVPGNPDAFHDAMPDLPAWAREGRTWAPEVMRVGDNYILYFTAHHRGRDQQCIGAAVSRDPRGPFVPQGGEPLVCQHRLGGTIDANPFRDSDGTLYLYYKNDGNHPSARVATELWGQRLSPDGLSLVGEPVSLVRNDAGWEGHLVEAPFMVRHGAGYVLFFSANDFAWQRHQRLSNYATGYASCTSALGPCTDAPANPILASQRRPICLSGPGHPAVFEANGRQYVAFHAWAARGNCSPAGDARFLHVAPLTWNGDAPVIGVAAP
jgi:beta-xylosidase